MSLRAMTGAFYCTSAMTYAVHTHTHTYVPKCCKCTTFENDTIHVGLMILTTFKIGETHMTHLPRIRRCCICVTVVVDDDDAQPFGVLKFDYFLISVRALLLQHPVWLVRSELHLIFDRWIKWTELGTDSVHFNSHSLNLKSQVKTTVSFGLGDKFRARAHCSRVHIADHTWLKINDS